MENTRGEADSGTRGEESSLEAVTAMPQKGFVRGGLSRLGWHLGLLAAAVYGFLYVHILCESLEFSPYSAFIAAGAATIMPTVAVATYVVRDERLADRLLRDAGLAWLYMFVFAPILSVNLLPDLPIDRTTFGEIGAQIEKGMVTHEHLSTIHMHIWNESGRSEWLPTQIPALSNFAPVMRLKIPREDIDHSTRQLTRTSRGERKVDYDLLVAKFYLPEVQASDLDEEPVSNPAEEASSETTDMEKSDNKDSSTEADGSEDIGTLQANNTTASAIDEDIEVAARSYVQMVIRASPRLKLYPHPKRKKASAQKRIMQEELTICGKFFNGIPRGEARDEEAAKLDIDLPKDPNSLAFSFRAEGCSWEPFLFGHAGVGMYVLFIPLYLIARKFIFHFSATIMGMGDRADSIGGDLKWLKDELTGSGKKDE